MVEKTHSDHTAEVEDTIKAPWNIITAGVDARLSISVPCVAGRLVSLVKGRIQRNWRSARRLNHSRRRSSGGIARVGKRVTLGDIEAVPIGRDTEDDLIGGKAGSSPSLEGGNSRALLIGRRGAGVVQGGVGTDAVGPGAPDIVAHDLNVVKNLREWRHVRHGLSVGIEEWVDRDSSGKCDVRSGMTKRLEEG